MKPTTGHKALLRLWGLYVLALLAPVLLALFLLSQSENSLLTAEEARTRQALEAKARQTALVIDEAVERAQAAAYSLWRSDGVSPLLRGGRGDQYRVVNQLNDLTLVNSRLIEDIALCFHTRDLTLTASGPSDEKNVYARFIDGGMTQNAWREAALGFTGGQLICQADGKITFLQTYPVTPIGDTSRAALLVLLREALPDNTLLLDERTGRLLFGEAHGDWLTARETSGRLPLVYVAQADGATLSEYAAAMRIRMLRACALCLLGAAALAFLLARRQLNPLRRLAALARGESAALPLDPYAEIQTALLEAQQQRLSLEGQKKEDERAKRLRALMEALDDPALGPEGLTPYMEAVGLLSAGAPVCLARLSCADADARLLGGDAGREPLLLAGEIVRGLLGRRWDTRAVCARDECWFFLLPDEKQLEGFSGQVSATLSGARRLLREAYGLDTQAVQSAPFAGAQGLLRAFSEIKGADAPDPDAAAREMDGGICRRAADYVAAHYADPDLSVATVARELGYSVEYLSRTFKRGMGQGLLTYIHGYQVEKAKELLRETPPRTVRQVAAMVGFSGSESFIRTFKRHQGVTPGRYQEEERPR